MKLLSPHSKGGSFYLWLYRLSSIYFKFFEKFSFLNEQKHLSLKTTRFGTIASRMPEEEYQRFMWKKKYSIQMEVLYPEPQPEDVATVSKTLENRKK